MRLSLKRIFSLLVLTLWLNGCTVIDEIGQQIAMPPSTTPLPAHPLYVLTMSAGQLGINQLVIVNPATWQVTRQVPLLSEGTSNLSRDPQGQIWLGYDEDHRVQVFAPDGRLLKTLTACLDPYLTIHFAAGRAFIPCLQSGFYAAVVVVDLQSLEIVKKLDVRIDGDIFLLIATGGDENYFAMVGNGDKTNRVSLVDTHTMLNLDPIPIPPSSPGSILAYQGRFYILNAYPNSPPTGREDLLIVDPGKSPAVRTETMAADGALWGVIEGNKLYTYHNIENRGMRSDPVRAISRLDLATHQSKLWPLPDHWNADDIAMVNGQIILAHSIFQNPGESGLYRFDPATGKLTMLVNIPGAVRILPPAP